jgi:hypothetical protein
MAACSQGTQILEADERDALIDLEGEFETAVQAVNASHFASLERAGVHRRTLFAGAMRFGVAEITPVSSSLYQPVAGGASAFIMPAIPLSDGELEDDVGDLVAWLPDDPERWWFRTGVLPILNPDAIAFAEHFRAPLYVWRSPLSWLRHHATGCVLLDRELNLHIAFGGVADVVAEDVDLAEEIDRRLRKPLMRTRILVARAP